MPVMRIKSSVHDYQVDEYARLDEALGKILTGRKIFAVVDKKLFGLPHAAALAALDPQRTLQVEASEAEKSFENLAWIFSALLERGFRKDCELLAVGGGVVQDITCFVASVLLRGAKWHFIPTTLLAQCDSCIGSKSSINIGKFKNQIGNFYPPNGVALVTGILETLPPDEIRSGLGEAIKLHLLSSEPDFRRLQSQLQALPSDPKKISDIIWNSLRIKQRYIEVDEFDKGVRNILNYGHTFGHAYESVTNYAIPHGIAVTLGVATATFFSEQLGLAPAGHFAEVGIFLKPWYEPYQQKIKNLGVQQIAGAMKLDKKNTSGTMNCILTRGFGKMEKMAVDPETQLLPLLEKFRGSLS
jgi:3-dehydroquinate synthase